MEKILNEELHHLRSSENIIRDIREEMINTYRVLSSNIKGRLVSHIKGRA
jgi:hypothetical protein